MSDPTLVLRNFTEVKRIDKRLHSIGDWVLPFAIPYRGLGLFMVLAIPTWLILSVVGVGLEPGTLWIWLVPPFLGAALAYTLRIQGKSLSAAMEAQVSFAVWWLAHRNDAATREYEVLCVRWVPDHPAYAAAAVADGSPTDTTGGP